MLVVGDSHTPHLDIPAGTAATQAALVVVDPDDHPTPMVVTSSPDGTEHTGSPLILTLAGQWRLLWSTLNPVTRRAQTVDVGPDPHQVPVGFSFATTGDWYLYSDTPPPDGLRRLLADASAEIERITMAAVYYVAADGRPADPLLRRALAHATVELVSWWEETGTATGGRALYTSASIAGVSLGMGGANTQNPQADRVGPKVWTLLLNAGLLRPGAVGSGG